MIGSLLLYLNLVPGRSIGLMPVIVSWDGCDFKVWISSPAIDRIDSWEAERRKEGWNVKLENGFSAPLGSSGSSDGEISSFSSTCVDSSVEVKCRSGRSPTSLSLSSWITLSG
jgi:hypothetical protein